MADSSSTSPLHQASPPASFAYPRLNEAYIVHLHRIQAARRRRPIWSRRVIVGSFCIFGFAALLTGSIWLLISSYSTKVVNMGRNFSHVYTANPLFVKKIIVTNRLQNEGPTVYGFSTTPKLDKQINWTEVHDAFVQSGGYQEWDFWLNKGSQVEFSYNISDTSLKLLLVVVQGEENMEEWVRDQSSTDFVASWKAAQGTGVLHFEVGTDQRYFFALGNTQLEGVEVNLKLNLHSKIHNNDNYKSQCHLTSSNCAVLLDYLGSDTLLLTTPQTNEGVGRANALFSVRSVQQDDDDDSWSVSVAFEQRWFTYLIFWGAMAVVMLILLTLCRPSLSDADAPQDTTHAVSETATPLLISQEESDKVLKAAQSEACSIILSDDALEGTEDSEQHLCIICFDQQRNCFFDPCGHCATCYGCSMKIAKEKKAVCPLCRQPIRLVRKIFVC
eukprot:c20624_g1_i1 orf=143-1474(-)